MERVTAKPSLKDVARGLHYAAGNAYVAVAVATSNPPNIGAVVVVGERSIDSPKVADEEDVFLEA
ncbi:hypothetical protein PYJP_11490 [Pyrofollis japonicus]|nr:hypothetical protein PYJP_11490 [Pyrofollis japonicus]